MLSNIIIYIEMGKGIYKQNTADLNNQLKQENKRIVLMNKLKNKVEEKTDNH